MLQGKVISASLSDQVYNILKRNILERKLAASSKLDIDSLAVELGVSRTPILDALTRLEAEGFITRRNRVGTFVTPLDRSMFDEIIEAREMIENWVAGPVISCVTDANLAELQAILDLAGAALDVERDADFDYLKFTDYDQQFHNHLVELCANSRIIAMYAALNSHLQIARVFSLRALKRSRESRAEHAAILAAYKARDEKAAIEAQLAHIEQSRAGIHALLSQYGVL